MAKAKILIQLDGDTQPSVFDSVVAIDSGADRLLRHGGVTPSAVRDLVYGAIFTRAPDDLRHTAIFVGGQDVLSGEAIFEQVLASFFGPLRVSVMLDANGANTTAAAAVVVAESHLDLEKSTVVVFGATGPVGQRVVRLLARKQAQVRVVSRNLQRAEAVCRRVREQVPEAELQGFAVANASQADEVLQGAQAAIGAGAAGAELITTETRRRVGGLRLAIDLNAVPPAGIEGIEPADQAAKRDGQICYGAIGIGGLKMKIHKAAIKRLFETNDQVLDAEQIFAFAEQLPNR